MKIEVNIEKKYFFGLMIIGLVILGVVGVVAYNIAGTGGDPAVFGHSVDEIDWTKTIQGNVSVNGTINAARFCIGTNCITSWPMGGGVGGNLNIIAGSGILITQSNGNVTISATGGGGTGGGSQWTTGTNGINYNGNVGIGAAAQSDNKLYVDGSLKVDGPYINMNEDTNTSWVNLATGDLDNCPGADATSAYTCATTDSITSCRDIRNNNQKRDVTCIAKRTGFGVYDGNGIILNEAVRISHISGTNPTCPSGAGILMRKIVAKTCGNPATIGCGQHLGCTIPGGWGGGSTNCSYCDCTFSTQGSYCHFPDLQCQTSWTDVLCVGDA
jgi:hypothetical protein